VSEAVKRWAMAQPMPCDWQKFFNCQQIVDAPRGVARELLPDFRANALGRRQTKPRRHKQ
jgi:hypothetical protein